MEKLNDYMYIVELLAASIGVFTSYEKMIKALEHIVSLEDANILYIMNFEKEFVWKNTNKHIHIRKLKKNTMVDI